MLNIFSKMGNSIKYRVNNHRPGLYLYILFPISFAFLATFTIARLLNYILPDLYIPWSYTFHIHHFTYGFFILAASGYLALIHDGPRARYLISLLHGFGLGLVMDEYAIWLKLVDNDPARWSYDGFLIFSGVVLLIISAKPGIHLLKNLWPFD